MGDEFDFSIVIPAFNEGKRLAGFLEPLSLFCKKSPYQYEVIIVDDGSTDNTADSAKEYKNNFKNYTFIRMPFNKGKGRALRQGLLRARGKICLFMDADGSVMPDEIEKNAPYILKQGYDIFIGSRVLKNREQILIVKWYRKLIGTIFNFFVHVFLFKDIYDTQCGFKMFRKEVIQPLFSSSRLSGFGFDMEMLCHAKKNGYNIKEGPVSWKHVAGSKINLITDSAKMFVNILQIRHWYGRVH